MLMVAWSGAIESKLKTGRFLCKQLWSAGFPSDQTKAAYNFSQINYFHHFEASVSHNKNTERFSV